MSCTPCQKARALLPLALRTRLERMEREIQVRRGLRILHDLSKPSATPRRIGPPRGT